MSIVLLVRMVVDERKRVFGEDCWGPEGHGEVDQQERTIDKEEGRVYEKDQRTGIITSWY